MKDGKEEKRVRKENEPKCFRRVKSCFSKLERVREGMAGKEG
jgi:hypothetical protein